MDYCSLGHQYLSGLICGGAVGWILSLYCHEKIVKLFSKQNKDQKSPPPGRPSFLAEKPPTIDDIVSDKNTIVLRLTDNAILKLLSEQTNHSVPEPKCDKDELEDIFTEASNQINILKRPFVQRDELDDDYEEDFQKDIQKNILEVGKLAQNKKSSFPTSKGGGYLTMNDLEKLKKEHDEAKDVPPISRADEMEIMRVFRGIIGMNFWEAKKKTEEEGYNLHILYIGLGAKNPLSKFTPATLGIRIKDPIFDFVRWVASKEAVVTEIIDVGGVDLKNRGIINL
jgi:hypothetical protein